MNNRLREIILNIVLEELESNTSPIGDLESFKEIILNDFGIEAGEDAFNFYIECHSLNPQGFYLVYKNELEFSPEFKAKYDLEEDEELITESKESKKLIKENEEDKDSFKVQEIDREGNKLDQFANFATAEEAIAFAKTLKTPAEVIDTTLSESLKEEKVIWTNLDTLEEALSRDAMISELKAKGKNYNFNKYSDSQIYYMYQREMNKKVEKPSNKIEANDKYKEIKKCPQCNHQLTDGDQCPVCDLGDEEERSNHMLYLDESLFTEEFNLLNEEVLNEGPFGLGKKNLDKTLSKIDKKDAKNVLKSAKSVNNVIASTLKDTNRFLIGDKFITYTEYKDLIAPFIDILRDSEALKNLSSKDPKYDAIVKAINCIVVDKDGWIIRRGTELIKPKTYAYNPRRPDLLTIKDQFKAEKFLGSTVDIKAPSDVTPDNNIPPKPNSWLNSESFNYIIQMLIKNNDGLAFYSKDSNGKPEVFLPQDASMDNLDNVFVDEDLTTTLRQAFDELKKSAKDDKEKAIKRAAIFGESYDDSMKYDDFEEKDLDEGLSKDEMDQVIALSKQIGIEDGKTMNRFIRDEQHPGESILDTLRRYIDSDEGDLEELEDDSWLPKTELSDEDIYDSSELYPGLANYLK